jgi:hypothetical protein
MNDKMSKHERIVEIDRTVEKLRDVIGTVDNGGSSGSSGSYGLPSTMQLAHITIEMQHSFCPSILNKTYMYRAAANIVVPLIQAEIEKLLEERARLDSGQPPRYGRSYQQPFEPFSVTTAILVAAAIIFLAVIL